MNRQQMLKSWKQIAKLNPDTAEAAGWHVDSIEYSPTLGHRVNIWTPTGDLGAWGYLPAAPTVAEAIRIAQERIAAL